MKYILEKEDPSGARAGRLELSHGVVETPIFMPVGTAGTVKAMPPDSLRDIDAQICLGNTYHLYLRPGLEVISKHGGLHKMMDWDRPLLTDSGGFQVFSLEGLRKIDKDGVTFRSHIDGSKHRFTPESVTGIQETIGADIAMAFDECPAATAPHSYHMDALDRTTRWAARCLDARTREDQAMFGIVQGGLSKELRTQHAATMTKMNDFEGFAIGGLSVGETTEELHEMTSFTAPLLPKNKPRYLMGVGTPEDLIVGVGAGVDMFDCVMPTRNARNGKLFTNEGVVSIKQARYRDDMSPLSESCPCIACTRFTKSYLRHLFIAKELLVFHLFTLHNLTFYIQLMKDARAAIMAGNYKNWAEETLAKRKEAKERDALIQKG